MWSWAESNRRPNKQPISFLHVYPVIGFRVKAGNRQPNLNLISLDFHPDLGESPGLSLAYDVPLYPLLQGKVPERQPVPTTLSRD